jgi:hypothetical protein
MIARAWWLQLFASVTLVQGAAPQLDYLFPAGGRHGTTLEVVAGGKFDSWPVEVWTSIPGINFESGEKAGEFTVEIAPDAVPGACLIRFYNEEGVSEPRPFVIGALPELLEKEPNDHYTSAQEIPQLPVVINGKLEKQGDSDSFQVRVSGGKWLIVSVEGYSLGAPMDPALHLYNGEGVRVAFVPDSVNLDPFLAYYVDEPGTYILQLVAFAHPPAADVRFTGGASCVYRMTVTEETFAPQAVPSGITLPIFPGLQNPADSDLMELIEREPNDSAVTAQPMPVPGQIIGRIDPPGDEDRFFFSARQGEKMEIHVESALLGFAMDALLRIEDESGKQLARDDDSGEGRDAKLTWTAPADGAYIAVVSDLYHAGGADFIYRLTFSLALPDFKAEIEGGAFKIEPGKSRELKLKLTRTHGHQQELSVSIDGLPEGLTVSPCSIATDSKEATLILSATAEAPAFNGPIRLLLAEAAGQCRIRTVRSDLRGNEERGPLLIPETDQLWLTVLPVKQSSAEELEENAEEQAAE